MGKPLELFIKPPYIVWTQIHGYGPDPFISNLIHSHLLLETTGEGQIVAAASGYLSARPPQGGTLLANQPMTIPSATDPLPFSVTLYLHLSIVTVALYRGFWQRAGSLFDPKAFAYFNVATSSLEEDLAELLDVAIAPRSISVPRANIVEELVRGQLQVPVTVGHAIGKAAPAIDAPVGSVRLGFTVLTKYGPIDPAYIYDRMRDFVEDGQPDLDSFLGMAPKGWPVISPATTTDDAIHLTETALYPWAVLSDMKNGRSLTPVQWRRVGNNQKAQWRDRLLKRTGHAPATSTAPPFEFDDIDWKNLFQMEAVVEFYANYPDPWATGAVPVNPGSTGYITVDFVNPAGTAANVAGNVVTLDGNPDLTRVREYYKFHSGPFERHDYIVLAADTGRASRMYKIKNVDNVAKTVTLDGTPILSAGTSPWEIKLRPVIGVIDSFGGRLRGDAATASGNVLALDGVPKLDKVNVNFDTIYLPSDLARASRAYRITDVDVTAKTVTLDAAPVLAGGSAANSSAWHLQSGISGELPGIPYDLGPGGTRGYDHFDGIIFVVFDGEIHEKIRWSSYTSRNYDKTDPIKRQFLSSLRGNRAFDFMSYRSDAESRNYSLLVVDQGASYDGVREARFYFETPVTVDNAPAGTNPNGGGKTTIRLHYSRPGTGGGGSDSAGCVVSPSYYDLRDLLIQLYQQEFANLNGLGTQDAEVQKAYRLDHQRSKDLFNGVRGISLSHKDWNAKIVGTVWVIRPDERSL